MSTNSSEDKSQAKKVTRRDFLKLAGVVGAVATLPSLIPFGKVFVIVYNIERPEDLGISGSVGSMSARVLDRMFGINPPGFFDQLNYKSSQVIEGYP